ncbi:MAG TPA: DUF4097 family beta strand repeat-containing protein [Terriglobales bacterium]|nr:DUF4097 family beta strand repeat-containing protein [Terriglobales bacterium]
MASVPPPIPQNPMYYPPPRRRSIFGPIVLITIGVVFLLVNAGFVTAKSAIVTFARFWPVLLIIWGVLRLVEYLRAKQEGVQPPGIGAGGVIGLIFLVLFGVSVSTAYRGSQHVNWNEVRNEMDIPDDEFSKWFGHKYEFTDNVDRDFPATASLKIVGDRGDINISPSTDGKLHITVRKVVYADNQDEANKLNQQVLPTITTVDNVLTIDTTRRSDWQGASLNLDIMAPKKAMADVMITRGDVTVSGREGNVKLQSQRGDITVEDLTGSADIHTRNGDVNARRISGDVAVEGKAGDVNVSDIGGSTALQGDFFGGISFSKVAKGVRFKSSRTDMEFAKLEGTLSMENGEMRGTAMTGPFRMNANRGWDMHLEDISGEFRVENQRGEVELHTKAPFGNMEISNRAGRIKVVMPPTAGFSVEARSRGGEIESDFELTKTEDHRESRATGTINKGGPKLTLNNEHGVIELRRN